MSALISLVDAQERLLTLVNAADTIAPQPVESLLGGYLAEPLLAARTQPAADVSAMDGYAVAGKGAWKLVGESRCGLPFGSHLADGDAVRISTGAHCPAGTQAILIQENAQVEGEILSQADGALVPGEHIRREGFDFADGDPLLPGGTRIGPAQIALARAAGHGRLPARRKPRIVILECGDELTSDPASCGHGQIPASNGAMLAAMASAELCDIVATPPLRDTPDALVDALDAHATADLLVFSGGASVGDHDHVRPSLQRAGADIAFWKVAMRPGKPVMVAQLGKQLILGLPGNPVSSFVTAFHFMLPAIRRLCGASECLVRPVPILLGRDMAAVGGRQEFVRAQIADGVVTPLDQRDSSALLTLATANALIDRPAHSAEMKAGTHVPTYPIQNGGNA
ncbi:Molybdopterin molybdotransferase [Alteripontixanthobacter maritimus]|uniref:Molybdopterin molybdenumtransferase n=1 Tax=Alteripontixanthobacter maritimus TaxID=2161824 RepID=A0A369Q544_9SPHN|nr:molybdopterin molybdotransferase MoeA [Alteripontixanthobacter maritimus]RDC60023.1 Molybdopterin molybdotransferase [Alteripontixanthobacter maritimus]